MKKHTNWTEATTVPLNAIAGLMSALNAGKNAWIERQKNGEQDFPVKIKNPLLDNPFNWIMSYGVPSQPPFDQKYFNETEKDLTLNYTSCFGKKEAVELYQQKGELVADASCGMGICHPVKKQDVLRIRPDLGSDWRFWTTYWKPKHEIPYWIPDPSIESVFVVCTNDEPADNNRSIRNAIEFLSMLIA